MGADRALKVLGLMRVSDVINRNPKNIIQGTDRSPEALKFLDAKGFRYGIVIERNKPIGHVTRKSLKYEEGQVRDVVEQYPLFLREKTSLRNVLSFMLMHDVATFCVVDEDKNFAGTVTYNDIQKAVKESYADEAAESNENEVSA